ncbi:hypothetical protein THASP1DRAFT_32197 [Thamnocephalis sphaerospora]|uniref:Uncharacterized protein n=1 Tax=Thamnocephalis sphaerospora TaxID=78915 RepID=A0A4P9XJP7_9FUNG|nr:hypothetical protein THASP1DRAFT_32197 [Thamnocephalis sphaerospora]|eukprot:RKP05972.1 hypothetical protein THASP1DRAFT_32197 [Thamnocephalis sphaerospora]
MIEFDDVLKQKAVGDCGRLTAAKLLKLYRENNCLRVMFNSLPTYTPRDLPFAFLCMKHKPKGVLKTVSQKAGILRFTSQEEARQLANSTVKLAAGTLQFFEFKKSPDVELRITPPIFVDEDWILKLLKAAIGPAAVITEIKAERYNESCMPSIFKETYIGRVSGDYSSIPTELLIEGVRTKIEVSNLCSFCDDKNHEDIDCPFSCGHLKSK